MNDGPGVAALDRSASDLERALQRALALRREGVLGRIVLLSDGRFDGADPDAALERVRVAGVPVDTRPTLPRRAVDAWLQRVDLPAQVAAGAPFEARIHVGATVATEATVALLAGAEVLAARRASLRAGDNDVLVSARVTEAGAARLTAVVRARGDEDSDNDALAARLAVTPPPRVLYVEGRRESSAYLATALRDGGFDVLVVGPAALPLQPAGFAPFDAVILSDVRADRIPLPTMEALAYYVEQLGGGLLLAGGEEVFGEEGYADTRLEQVMPVWFKAEHEPRDLALVIALDKSYSMVGDKMALAKEASKAAVALLQEDQRFGLLAFDYHFYWPVPIRYVTDQAAIDAAISSIEASSPTNIYPALQEVYEALLQVDAEVKHVILLSDGKTYEDDYEGLVTRMAEDQITVSTVAVGDKADRELLGDIARWGKGRAYAIDDPTRVPQIFIDETQMAQGITIAEREPVVPEVRKPVEALVGLEPASLPPLRGYVRTMAKDNAEVVLQAGSGGDPILVRWRYGLGRSVFFAADVKNRWASEWVSWPGYGRFFSQLVRETMRQAPPGQTRLTAVRAGASVRLTLDVVDARGRFRNDLRPELELVRDDGSVQGVRLEQVAPGRYAGAAPLPLEQGAGVRWRQGRTVLERALAPVPESERASAPDRALLRAIARRTGGRYEPDPAALADPAGRRVDRRQPLWPWLAALALPLYLGNLLLRRVRLFEPKRAAAD